MKSYKEDFFEERDYSGAWIPYLNVLAAVVVISLIFVAVSVLQKNGSLPQQSITALEKTVENADAESTEQADAGQLTVDTAAQERLQAAGSLLTELAGVKQRIIDQLINKFEGSELKLEVDKQTGTVRFREADFFDPGKTTIKKSGETYLKEFFPQYVSVLFSEENRKYVDRITIEGHTDNDGTYLYNLDLSQKRAYAVAMYIVSDKFPQFTDKKDIIKYLAANGRSYNEPIKVDGVISKQRSRRVEFKFQLKYDEVMDEMLKALEGDN